MTQAIQCENCGAVLLQEDVFCGECGAPRPVSAQAAPASDEGVAPVPPPPPPPTPAPAAADNRPRWRAVVITLIVLGAIACVLGLASFVLFGATPSEATSPEEDWILATVCCLLPIGGTGALLLAVGGALWYARLREQ